MNLPWNRKRTTTYSVPDEDVLATGVRFTVAELATMAEKVVDQGLTPPPLSMNETHLLMVLIRQRMEASQSRASSR